MIFRATRLAPSPTGALHLGHARTFLITWWLARQAGAKIFMRMDDLDAGRAKPESVAQAYDDLRWLGMDWDAWSDAGAPTGVSEANGQALAIRAADVLSGNVVQSRRMEVYQAALERLWASKMIYPCVCRRADIEAQVASAASAPHEEDRQPRYRGTCRARYTGKALHDALNAALAETQRACVRLMVREGNVAFDDAIAGPQRVDVQREVGDFPVTRFVEPGNALTPAYQLACVVDDHAMNIDLVVRGDDLLASTPRQLLLYEALGFAPPRFAHLPLVIGPDGKRLAKRHGESRIAQFRAAGIPPEKIVGWAAWRSGQLDKPREITASEMVARFDLARLPRERVVLGPEDLAWLS